MQNMFGLTWGDTSGDYLIAAFEDEREAEDYLVERRTAEEERFIEQIEGHLIEKGVQSEIIEQHLNTAWDYLAENTAFHMKLVARDLIDFDLLDRTWVPVTLGHRYFPTSHSGCKEGRGCLEPRPLTYYSRGAAASRVGSCGGRRS
jgi:hypothetical protein